MQFGLRDRYTDIVSEVHGALEHQIDKWGIQSHAADFWCVIEGEEFGEMCRAAFEWRKAHEATDNWYVNTAKEDDHGNPYIEIAEKNLDDFEREALQVAAVAIAAVESIRRQRL